MSNTEKPCCGQCGKPAVAMMNDVPLCVDHWVAVETARMNQARHHMAMLNYLEEQMAGVAGMPWLANRIQIPPMPSSPITLNNFRLTNSSIGAVNTGNVRDIEVSLEQLHNAGNDKACNALLNFTQAILNDKSLKDAEKNELVEQVAYISGQVTAAAQDRKPAIIKPILESLGTAATTVSSLAGAWQAAEPILRSILG